LNNYAKLSKTFILACLSIAFFYGCSSQKDNAANRALQNLSARYNYIYNSNLLLNKYQEELSLTYKDNYDEFLAVYISPATADYLNTVGNNTKDIENISVKAQAIIAEKNLSNYIDEAYLLLGKTNFYKGNYFNAVEYFDYTAKTYKTNKKIFLSALNWKARSLMQLNNFEQASKVLDTVKATLDSVKNEKAEPLATLAQMSIYQHDLKQAIIYLEQAIKETNQIQSRTRWPYILAQLYENEKDYDASLRNYTKVENSNAPFEMYFNAKVSKIRIYDFLNDQSSNRKLALLKLLKDDKNFDYTDQIYYEVAEDYLLDNDYKKAQEYYKLSAQKSTINQYQKGISYLKNADLNFKNIKDYVTAKLYYDSAINTLPKNYPNYESIVKKGENLEYLTSRYQLIATQDTLQFIAKLTEPERLKKLDLMFEPKKEIANTTNLNVKTLKNADANTLSKNQNNGTFYFSNINAISKGFTDFKKRWGNRPLEDNWRQSVKSSLQVNQQNQNVAPSNTNSIANNNSALNTDKDAKIKEYIALLPLTIAQIEKSNQQIIDAYFEIAGFYQQVLEDQEEAGKVYETLLARYPDNNHLEAVYYSLYLSYKNTDPIKSNEYKNILLNKYSASVYAKTILDPNFSTKQNALDLEVNKIYNSIFDTYQKKDFSTVIIAVNETNQRFPGNNLQAQYDYLKAIAIGRTQNVDSLLTAFNQLIAQYPNDQLINPLVKDHINYINANLASFKSRKIALIDFDINEPPFLRQQLTNTVIKAEPLKTITPVVEKPIIINQQVAVNPPVVTPVIVTPPVVSQLIQNNNAVIDEKKEPIKPIIDTFFSLAESKIYYYVINVEDINVSLSSSRFGVGQFNRGNFSGGNLKHQLVELDENQLIYVGNFDTKEEAKEYYDGVTSQLPKIMKVSPNTYKGFYISKENFDKLKNKETINRYLEFFKNNY
jgi:hypothetical protein